MTPLKKFAASSGGVGLTKKPVPHSNPSRNPIRSRVSICQWYSGRWELSVAKEDLGKVIGKQGRTARAIRVILGAVSANLGKRSVLEIIE